MKEFNLFITYVYTEARKGKLPILCFAIHESEESAERVIKSTMAGVDQINFKLIISWSAFKNMYDTSSWPDVLKYNDSGLFDDDDFMYVCAFSEKIFAPLLQYLYGDRYNKFNLN